MNSYSGFKSLIFQKGVSLPSHGDSNGDSCSEGRTEQSQYDKMKEEIKRLEDEIQATQTLLHYSSRRNSRDIYGCMKDTNLLRKEAFDKIDRTRCAVAVVNFETMVLRKMVEKSLSLSKSNQVVLKYLSEKFERIEKNQLVIISGLRAR